jgi:pyruvate/2-oxoglutarate dehydrogenase complex dihydrolipoamide dehydrogenase (E3) component
MLSCQYLIIGAGSTGLKVANSIAATGVDVILVDKSNIGGHFPSIEGFFEYLQSESRSFGASLKRFKDFPETFTVLRNNRKKIWRDSLKVIENNQLEITKSINDYPNLKFIKGQATFFSKSIVEVNEENSRNLIQFNQCILATGKNYKSELDSTSPETVFTIDTLHQLSIIPSKVAIVGINEQSLSVAGIFAQLGVKVYVFDKLKPSQVLPNMDRSAFNYLIKFLASWQVEFHFKTAISSISKQPRATLLTDKNGLEYKTTIAYLPSSRFYDTKNLNLAKVSIKTSPAGIPTNHLGRTVYKNIWALGDCSAISNKLNKDRILENFLDKFKNPTPQNNWLSFTPSNKDEFADPRKTGYTCIDLDYPVLTIGLPEHEAVKRYGSTFGSKFYQAPNTTGFIKLLYKTSMKQPIGISVTGQVSSQLELVCFEWLKRGASSDYIDSYLTRLGYKSR